MRCERFRRGAQDAFDALICDFVDDLVARESEIAMQTAQFVIDNVEDYLDLGALCVAPPPKSLASFAAAASGEVVLRRAFFRFERMPTGGRGDHDKGVVSIGQRLGLSGFVLCGKPALAGVEGIDDETDNFQREARKAGLVRRSCRAGALRAVPELLRTRLRPTLRSRAN